MIKLSIISKQITLFSAQNAIFPSKLLKCWHSQLRLQAAGQRGTTRATPTPTKSLGTRLNDSAKRSHPTAKAQEKVLAQAASAGVSREPAAEAKLFPPYFFNQLIIFLSSVPTLHSRCSDSFLLVARNFAFPPALNS